MSRLPHVLAILLLVLVVSAALLVSGCGDEGTGSTSETGNYGSSQAAGTTDGSGADGTSSSEPATTTSTERSPGMGESNPRVLMSTSVGDITLELDSASAPDTVANFLKYAEAGFYEGTVFHRVIPGFMIQGGGFTQDMQQKQTQAPVKNEAGNGLKNSRGTIAMARTQVVDSATSQFFINLVDNAALDHRDNSPSGFGYAVFGKVVEGMETVDAIAQVSTTTRGFHENVPVEPIVIDKVTVLE